MVSGYVEKPYGALMLDELEDYEELISALSSYISSGQPAGVAVHNRALAYWEIGDPDKALSGFDEAAKLLPKSHMPLKLKGMLLEKIGRHEEALLAYSSAISVAPNEATIRRARALLLVDMGKIRESICDFDRAISLEPKFSRTREDREKALAHLTANSGAKRKVWWRFWSK